MLSLSPNSNLTCNNISKLLYDENILGNSLKLARTLLLLAKLFRQHSENQLNGYPVLFH